MEEPDRDAAPVEVAQDKTCSDAMKASLSSEDSDSWTLLGKGNDQQNKEPSGVQEITKEEESAAAAEEDNQPKEKSFTAGKLRHDSQRSIDSQLDESSDGISVISESDAANRDKLPTEDESNDEQAYRVRFRRTIDLKLPDYVPLTPPYTPDEVKSAKKEQPESQKQQQQQQLQVEQRDEQSLEPVRSLAVEHSAPAPVSSASWILFGLLATAMAAVILGNSMRLQNRVDEINFEHEKRISELELENNILKNEMNKLRHLYTRSELDEQVQRAEFEWMDALRREAMNDPLEEGAEPLPEAEPTPPTQPVRKVPPQDGGVKRKVVWSGDEEEPMLIADKDYVLPAFCYNQDKAVQDDLFSEYSAKYCDVKKRKIEAKQRKSEFQQKKAPKQENYNKFIHPKPAAKEQQQGPIEPGKLASPFNIDYKKAFDAIKAEGSVIVEALGSILDLSPEPEDTVKAKIEEVIPPDSIRKEQLRPEDNKQPSDTMAGNEPEPPRNDNNRPAGKNERSSEGKAYNKRKDDAYRQDSAHKHKKGREESGESKDRQASYREKDSYEHKKYEASHENGGRYEKNKHQHSRQDSDEYKRKSRDRPRHDDDDDDDEDDHYRKKFDRERENSKERDHKHHQRNGKWKQGSGERPKHVQQGSDEGSSYLDQYKRQDWKHGGKQQGSGDHQEFHKQHKKNGYKQGADWSEKRSNGRDEYRQGGGKHRDRGSGEDRWQERMKHGRQEARDEQRKQMDRENNWYLERGNQREEERFFPHQQQPAAN